MRRLQHSERAHERGVILPLVPSMSTSQVQDVCDILSAAIEPSTRRVLTQFDSHT